MSRHPPRSRSRSQGLPTLADWTAAAQRLGLRRIGSELSGRCPSCGGEDRPPSRGGRSDRFYVRADGRAYCRRCCPHGRDPEALRRIVEAAGFPWPGADPSAPGRRSPAAARRAESAPPPPQPDPRPAELWRRCANPEGTPAAAWIRRRTGWPADRELPRESVRWMPPSLARREHPLPRGCAGAAAYGFSRPRRRDVMRGPVEAVQYEALDAGGRPLDPRWRRCAGSKAGLVFELPGLGEGGQLAELAVCEGELDAIALAWTLPDAERIRAAGGTGGLALPACAGPWDRIRIESDGDPAGREAASGLAAALRRTLGEACPVLLRLRVGGADPASEIAG